MLFFFISESKRLTMDLEQLPVGEKRLLNAPVETLSWSGLTVTIKEGKTGQSKTLVDNVEGIMQAGWLMDFLVLPMIGC